jgi:hypothetical protein
LALALPALLMALGALETPAPWHVLWLAVPALGAIGYLGNLHRWRWGWLAPLVAAAWMVFTGVYDSIWAWLLVGGVASAALLGLARGQGAPSSRGLWAFLPLLSLSIAFPFSSLYQPAMDAASRSVESLSQEAYQGYRQMGLQEGSLGEMTEWLHQATQAWTWLVRHLLPTLLFVFGAVLVALGVLLARRAAMASGKPVAGEPFARFRLPEGAIWVMLVALAMIALRRPELIPPGVNLALCVGLGYCLQGIAVLDFALLARGLPPGIIWVLFLFVVLFAVPVLAVTSTGLGLIDVWLDLRRGSPEKEREDLES